MKKYIFIICTLLLILFPKQIFASDTWIAQDIQNICVEYGNQYGISPELLMAIIETESSGNPMAENGDCKGLMQISARWHRSRMERLGVSNLFDIRENILVGCDYLSELINQHGDIGVALMVYHGESGATTKTQLSYYAARIIGRSEELKNEGIEVIETEVPEMIEMEEILENAETPVPDVVETAEPEVIEVGNNQNESPKIIKTRCRICTKPYKQTIKEWLYMDYHVFIFNSSPGQEKLVRTQNGTKCNDDLIKMFFRIK